MVTPIPAMMLALGVMLVQPMVLFADDGDSPLPVDSGSAIDQFRAQVKADPSIDEKVRKSTLQLIDAYRADEDSRVETITAGLRQVNPTFQEAMEALADEDLMKADKLFTELRKSKDRFVASHATFFHARTFIVAEEYERALPLITQITDGKYHDDTLYQADAMFFHGVCLAKTLKRKPAIETLKSFLKLDMATVSERMQVGALHMIADLETIEDGSIIDVQDRMEYSERRLVKEKSGKQTQGEQDRIIAMLDKLIEEAEKKEQQGSGSGSGGGQGQGQQGGQGGQNPSGPAEQSGLPPGSAEIGGQSRVNRGKASDSWGNLPEKERTKILAGLKARFPGRYKKLIEQYYKSFQEEKKP